MNNSIGTRCGRLTAAAITGYSLTPQGEGLLNAAQAMETMATLLVFHKATGGQRKIYDFHQALTEAWGLLDD